MEIISISQDPNQVMQVSRDEHQYEISLRTYADITLVTVVKDGEPVVRSLPGVLRGWFIPYDYLVGNGGNLRFESTSEEYPFYTGFGTKFNLVYYPHDEYVAIRQEEEQD